MIQAAMRTAGIWIEEGHILLESLAGVEVWGVPGGHLEPDESAEAGCLREYREELGLEMQTDGLAIIHENFWRDGHEAFREYCFYFRVRPRTDLPSGRRDVRSREAHLQFRWFHLDELDHLELVPSVLPDILRQFDPLTHFLSTIEKGFSC